MTTSEQSQAILAVREKYAALQPCLHEKGRRLWAATEARFYGYGGIKVVMEAIGISHKTVQRGLRELESNSDIPSGIRKPGGGRKSLTTNNPQLLKDLESLLEPTTRGCPESPLRWTSKSVRKLATSLQAMNHKVSFKTVSILLKQLGYSLQSNRKKQEGSSHPDRDAQFQKVDHTVQEGLKAGIPCISVDTKKKENIGNYKNNGQEYAPKGKPCEVKTHDFPNKELGKVAPYGVYDMGSNTGWVSVGISADTAEFSVNSIRTWWHTMGKQRYAKADRIVITADCGGSNGYRVRLWKVALQKLANELQKNIVVRHFPPGTSKWNKIEHRLFSYISKNWRGKPLVSVETVVNLISNTTTKKGLSVRAAVDENEYEKGKKISDEEMNGLNIVKDDFHPEWNYEIRPIEE